MKETLKEKVSRLLLLEPTKENENEIRALVSEIFLRSCELYEIAQTKGEAEKTKMLLSRCLKKLRAVNNKTEKELRECEFLFVELDRLLESVCLCTDILLSDKNKKLFFESEKIAVSCCPQLIIDAFLNLISNAVKFSSGDIRASLSSGNRQCVITVSDAAKSEELSLIRPKDGLLSVQNTAKLHEGRLLFSSGKSSFSARMALSLELPRGKRYHAQPFTAFLENRTSPVYVGLCDCME